MKACDHTSVGLLVWRDAQLLLIERRRQPFGYAPPAGHVDNHGSFEKAARAELLEEVGLRTGKLTLVKEGRIDNPCRRPGGTWHYWKIYSTVAFGSVHISKAEVKSFVWCNKAKLRDLAIRTRHFVLGLISPTEWVENPGLEPVWVDILHSMNILAYSSSGHPEEMASDG